MATSTHSFAIEGIEAFPVTIEASIVKGLPTLSIIGLGDQAVIEAGDRVRAAVFHCGFKFPSSKIIVNLAPGDQKKRGSHYDLGIALTILRQSDQLKTNKLGKFGVIGELSLNGYLRPCNGILPMVTEAKRIGKTNLIVPAGNINEAKLISGINVYGFNNLEDVIDFLENDGYHEPKMPPAEASSKIQSAMDFSEVRGQKDLIDAIVLGVAGGHNILMIGEPGCGKTMIAERIPAIMPTMTEQEALEVTKIQSVKGLLPPAHSLVTARPFRAPHHNASQNSLIGGGNPAQPGEVSLANNGVLFLDELPEFPRNVLESLRQPLENKKVTVSRVSGTSTFPANFMLVAAMNPCPCGYHPGSRCHCSDYEIKHYINRISGPILERIDIQKRVKAIDYFAIQDEEAVYTSAKLRAKVEKARSIQKERYKDYENVFCNAQLSSALIEKYCKLDEPSEALLKQTAERFYFSARVITKILRLARTCADLRGSEKIELRDVRFVISCRDLDAERYEALYTV